MLVLIVNPVAGCGAAKTVCAKLEAHLKQVGEDYQICCTQKPGHATELARTWAADPTCEMIVSVGGDGTASQVAAGVLGTGKPMAIVPAGTGNDLVRNFGYPKETEQIMDRILQRRLQPIDLVRLNDRCFLNVAGTGFDVTVLKETERYHGRFKGMVPYLLGLIRAIALYKPVHLKLDIDGQSIEEDVLICSVANGSIFGGGIPICPDARIDDGLLDVVIVKNEPRWKIPIYLPGLLMGKVLNWKITRHIHCRSITITGENMDFQTDGEIKQVNEVAIRVVPGELPMYR